MSNIKNKRQANKVMMMAILALSLVVSIAFVVNIVLVLTKKNVAKESTVDTTVEKNSLKNDLYTIGNNPTDINREEFQKLTNELKEEDKLKAADALARCFVTEFFTWTNKDGSYEVGGLQYLYGAKFTTFAEEVRWNFYKDLDLYITQLGREELIEVDSITTVANYSLPYTINNTTYDAFYIEATWTYKPTKLDTSAFQKTAYFTVINHDGRLEIVSFYHNYD